jgi:hypothetical protein
VTLEETTPQYGDRVTSLVEPRIGQIGVIRAITETPTDMFESDGTTLMMDPEEIFVDWRDGHDPTWHPARELEMVTE